MKLLTLAFLMLSVTSMGQSKHNIKVDTGYSMEELLAANVSFFKPDTNKFSRILSIRPTLSIFPKYSTLTIRKYGDVYTGDDTFKLQLDNCDSLYAIHLLYQKWSKDSRRAELAENLLNMLLLEKIATSPIFWVDEETRLIFKKYVEEYYCRPERY